MFHPRKGYVYLRQEFKGELFIGVTGDWDACTRRWLQRERLDTSLRHSFALRFGQVVCSSPPQKPHGFDLSYASIR